MKLFRVFLCYFVTQHVLAGDCDINFDILLTKGFSFSGETVWNFKTKDAVDCARSCIRRSTCTSFSFDTVSRLCKLQTEKSPMSKAGVNLVCSEIINWPSQTDPSCYNRPCAEDAVCIPVGSADGKSCSNSCLKHVRSCPFPGGSISNQSRTVGSVFKQECGPKFVGKGTLLCLESGEWNNTADIPCKPLYGSECDADDDCEHINGVCAGNTCTCRDGMQYNTSTQECDSTLYGSECDADDDCEHSNGLCAGNTCTCKDGMQYNTSAQKCSAKCEAEWVYYEDRCYFFGTKRMIYNRAEAMCAAHDGQIVYIETSAENEFVKDELRKIPQTKLLYGYWNSLREITMDTYKWMTDNGHLDANVLDWGGLEPDGGFSERCTALRSEYYFRWADYKCNSNQFPICKKNLI